MAGITFGKQFKSLIFKIRLFSKFWLVFIFIWVFLMFRGGLLTPYLVLLFNCWSLKYGPYQQNTFMHSTLKIFWNIFCNIVLFLFLAFTIYLLIWGFQHWLVYFHIFKSIYNSQDLNLFYKIYHILDYIFDPSFKVIIKPRSEFINVLDKARESGEVINVREEIERLEGLKKK